MEFRSEKGKLFENGVLNKNLYYITICTQNEACLFGEINNGKMELNRAGKMISELYSNLQNYFGYLQCHASIVMPNHFHCIIEMPVMIAIPEIIEPEMIPTPLVDENKKTEDEKLVYTKLTPNKLITQKEPIEVNEPVSQKIKSDKNEKIIINYGFDSPEKKSIIKIQNFLSKKRIYKKQGFSWRKASRNLLRTNKMIIEQGFVASPITEGQSKGFEIKKSYIDLIIEWFKAESTIKYTNIVKNNISDNLWQNNHYQQAIKKEELFRQISQQIIDNPIKWNQDTFYPNNNRK